MNLSRQISKYSKKHTTPPKKKSSPAQAIQNDLVSIPSNQTAAGKHIERVAQVAIEAGREDLGRRRAPAEQVADLPAVDLKGREALGERARGDGARGDGDVGAAAAGVKVGAEADEAGDVSGGKLGSRGEVEGQGGVGGGGDAGVGGGGGGGGAEGEEGGDEEGDGVHFEELSGVLVFVVV